MASIEPSSVTPRREVLPGHTINPQVAVTPAGSIEFDLAGRGGSPVVLSLHGGLGGCDQGRVMGAWVDLSRYRLLSPSRPGYLGTPLETGRSLEAQVDAVAGLLDALDIDRVAVLGASAGGPPAYTFALRHPDRVWGLIAIDAVSGYYDMPETAGPLTQAIFLSDVGQKLMQLVGQRQPKMLLTSLFQAEAYFTKQQMQAHIQAALADTDVVVFAQAFMETIYPWKLRREGTENDIALYRELHHLPLEGIRCPSLIVHGTHDSDVKFWDGVFAYETIPGAERHWIEEGSHMAFWLNPKREAAQRQAREFLDRYAPD